MKKLMVVIAVAAIVSFTGTAMAANNLTVNGTAALEGSYGLSVNIDGTDNLGDAYVVSDHPANETLYRFKFLLNPGTFQMDVGAAPYRYLLMGDGFSAGGTPPHFLFVWLMETSSGLWRLQANARLDAGGFQEWDLALPLCDQAGGAIDCSTIGPIPIQVEWAAATSPGANNGYIKVGRSWDGGVTFTNYIDVTGMDNDEYDIDAAWFGAIFMANATHNNPSGANGAGSFYFDGFESYRSTAP